MRVSILVALFICFYQTPFSQTLVIVRVEKEKIYLAADTRRIRQTSLLVGNRITSVNIYDTLTKVSSRNGISFGLMGSFAQHDVIGLPLRFCQKGVSIRQVAENYAKAQIDTLLTVMPYLKRNETARYIRDYKNKAGFIQAVFVGYDNKLPQIFLVNFFSYEQEGRIYIKHFISNPNETEVAIGHTNAIEAILHLKSTWRGNPTMAIISLFEKQIASTPESVAKPLDLLVITPQRTTYQRIK